MAGVQVIRKNKRNMLGDTLGALGQGMAGFGAGYMGGQQMNMMKENNDRWAKILEQMYGKNGEGIKPPAANTPDMSSLVPLLDLSFWR